MKTYGSAENKMGELTSDENTNIFDLTGWIAKPNRKFVHIQTRNIHLLKNFVCLCFLVEMIRIFLVLGGVRCILTSLN